MVYDYEALWFTIMQAGRLDIPDKARMGRVRKADAYSYNSSFGGCCNRHIHSKYKNKLNYHIWGKQEF